MAQAAAAPITVTLRFRGQFKEVVAGGILTLDVSPVAQGQVSLSDVLSRLREHIADPAVFRLLEHSAFFLNGRLLKADDVVPDKAILHILSPIIGG